MKDKIKTILTRFNSSFITLDEATESIFQLIDENPTGYKISENQEWAVGKLVKVTDCIYGHEYEIGDIVRIVEKDEDAMDFWLCDGAGWWLGSEEGTIVEKI